MLRKSDRNKKLISLFYSLIVIFYFYQSLLCQLEINTYYYYSFGYYHGKVNSGLYYWNAPIQIFMLPIKALLNCMNVSFLINGTKLKIFNINSIVSYFENCFFYGLFFYFSVFKFLSTPKKNKIYTVFFAISLFLGFIFMFSKPLKMEEMEDYKDNINHSKIYKPTIYLNEKSNDNVYKIK